MYNNELMTISLDINRLKGMQDHYFDIISELNNFSGQYNILINENPQKAECVLCDIVTRLNGLLEDNINRAQETLSIAKRLNDIIKNNETYRNELEQQIHNTLSSCENELNRAININNDFKNNYDNIINMANYIFTTLDNFYSIYGDINNTLNLLSLYIETIHFHLNNKSF